MLLLILIFFLLPIWPIFAQDPSWQRLNPGAAVSEAKAIAIDEAQPAVIYLGLQDALYKTQDYGENWSLLAQGLISAVNFLLIDKEDSKIIYAATQKGLFRSSDMGESWQKIFTGKDSLQQDVLGIALCYKPPKAVFIATRSGVFFSPVNRIIWQKVAGKISDTTALSIDSDP